MLHGVLPVALTEFRDLVRRPPWRVGVVAFAAWIAVLPRLSNPAAGVRDNAALAFGLAGTTVFSVVVLVAALTALRSVQRDDGAGLALEEASAPVALGACVAGRIVGCAAAALTLAVAGTALGAVGWIGAATPASVRGEELALHVALSLPCAALLGAAVGAACGALAPRDLAIVLVVGLLLGGRALGSALQEHAPWMTWILPDPGRLDASRELAFGRAVGVGAILLQAGAACVQVAGAGLAAAAGLRSRRT